MIYTEDRLIDLTLSQLKVICDTAANSLAGVRAQDPAKCSANIKVLVFHNDDPDVRYRTLQRSGQSDVNRYAEDKRTRPDPHYMLQNAYFFRILDEYIMQDYFVLPDIIRSRCRDVTAFVEYLRLNHGTKFTEPTLSAAQFYKYCIVVPIRGHWQALRHEALSGSLPGAHPEHGERAAYALLLDELVLGFLTVDSMTLPLNDGFDRNALNQLAREAFYVLRGYHCALAKLRQMQSSQHKTGATPQQGGEHAR